MSGAVVSNSSGRGDTGPIAEITLLNLDDLFEGQCLPDGAKKSEARVHDPTREYDAHGILTQRTPSGEVEVFIPHAFQRHGPHAIIKPIAGDGADLMRGPIRDKSENSNSPLVKHPAS
jgi:hypothetical protein